MKSRIFGFLFLLTLAISGSAFAQLDYPDYDIGGGGGGGSFCYLCDIRDSHAWCPAWNSQYSQTSLQGGTSCHPHNVEIGPPFCELGGSICYIPDGYPGPSNKQDGGINPDVPMHASSLMHRGFWSVEQQCEAIARFLRQSHLVPQPDLDDFIAETDYGLRGETYKPAAQKRLSAYRAKFAELMHQELRPGHIPIIAAASR